MTDKFSDLLEQGHRAQRENRLADARAAFIDCIRKASLDSDRASLAVAFIGLAEAENKIGNCAAAQHHYANAALLYRETGNLPELASALAHQADLLTQAKLPQEASAWIVRPKTHLKPGFGENDVRNGGLAIGLVDYKICSVSEEWSGLKFAWRKSAKK